MIFFKFLLKIQGGGGHGVEVNFDDDDNKRII